MYGPQIEWIPIRITVKEFFILQIIRLSRVIRDITKK